MQIIYKAIEYLSIGLATIILALGVWCFLNWIFWEWLLKPAMVYLRAYEVFVDYLFHRKEFNEYIKNNKSKRP